MKTLLTTDFTNASTHAIEYAIQLLSKEGTEYELIHAFKPMAPYAEISSIPVLENVAWKVELKKKLDELHLNIKNKYDIEIDSSLKRGGVYEVVHKFEKKRDKPDLVVMATREKSFFERMTLGSNALQVAEKAQTPVLIVPKEAEKKSPNKIAFATDLNPLEIPYDSLKLVKDLIHDYQAKLEVVHVYENKKEKDDSEKMKNTAIHRYLEEIDHKHIAVINDNVYDGIIEYLDKHQPDILVIIPRDHNFFEKIFNEQITKKMVNHTEIPLLVLN